MSWIAKGPLSPEDASVNYRKDLYSRLRCEDGWREDVWMRLFQEYDRFANMAIGGDFKAQSMWNYMRLVDVTDRYLYCGGSRRFSPLFYMKICEGLTIIVAQVQPSRLGEPERESMRLAIERMGRIVGWWKVSERAWE